MNIPRVAAVNPVRWNIYLVRYAPAKWLGAVAATDKCEAIEKAAEEFKTDAAKLIAVRRR
jgi:hypothetical protein